MNDGDSGKISRSCFGRCAKRPVCPLQQIYYSRPGSARCADGLKPVQRRILYAMYVDGNTHDKPFRKSAKTVGNVIGNYHPHGDSSVYEAMVRLSQDWKIRNVLVEMHGNNGSIDGDPPAAMRYTEARLSAIAAELLKDIDKNTVDFVPNFDDTIHEPTVLPAAFPNLLVNGSTGISADMRRKSLRTI